MRLLLDTHVALWAVTGSRALSKQAVDTIIAADEVTADPWVARYEPGSTILM